VFKFNAVAAKGRVHGAEQRANAVASLYAVCPALSLPSSWFLFLECNLLLLTAREQEQGPPGDNEKRDAWLDVLASPVRKWDPLACSPLSKAKKPRHIYA
jgi:hypothetical protein